NAININSNTIQNFEYLTATSGTMYGIYSTASAAMVNINNNTLSNITYGAASLTGTGILYGIYNTGSATTVNANGNSINGITKIGTTGANLYGIYFSSGTNQNMLKNMLNNFTISGTGT